MKLEVIRALMNVTWVIINQCIGFLKKEEFEEKLKEEANWKPLGDKINEYERDDGTYEVRNRKCESRIYALGRCWWLLKQL